jgi:hypothetical protein
VPSRFRQTVPLLGRPTARTLPREGSESEDRRDRASTNRGSVQRRSGQASVRWPLLAFHVRFVACSTVLPQRSSPPQAHDPQGPIGLVQASSERSRLLRAEERKRSGPALGPVPETSTSAKRALRRELKRRSETYREGFSQRVNVSEEVWAVVDAASQVPIESDDSSRFKPTPGTVF